MKFETREVKDNLLQITTQDERHYFDKVANVFRPSITWVTGMYPKGKEFYKWMASIGWDEAEALKVEAGDKGTRVHTAIEELEKGNVVKFDSKFHSRATGKEEELTAEEYAAVMSFAAWYNVTQPEIIHTEIAVFEPSSKRFSHGFGGSIDLVCRIDGQLWIIDFKTSKSVFLSHKIQLSAYKHIIEKMFPGEEVKIAVLQVGYAKNKKHYKFTECEDCFNLFEVAYRIWENEVKYKDVQQKDYPLEIRLESPKDLKRSRPVTDEEIEIKIPKVKAKQYKPIKSKTANVITKGKLIKAKK